MRNDSPVSKVSLKSMKIQRTNLTSWYLNGNEVLRIARYPNPVFAEMWFLTIDPFVGISVFIAKLSRTFIVKNIPNSLTYTVASSCVCTSPLAVMTIVGLHDFVKLSISALFKSFC